MNGPAQERRSDGESAGAAYGSEAVLRRSAVRVVLTDSGGQVLLLCINEPLHPDFGSCWELPGGGIETGETLVEAAQRELYEETGLRLDAGSFSAPRWFRSVTFLHAGVRRIQDESIFHAAVGTLAPLVVPMALASDETDTHQGYRWWPPAEIAHASTRFFPSSLPELLPRFLAGDTLHEPFEVFS